MSADEGGNAAIPVTPTAGPTDGASAALSIALFGPIEVRVEGDPLPPLRSKKGDWLLALLALRGGRPISRDHLAATLWPDSDADKALYNLRRTLHDLRHALGSQAWRLGSPEEGDDRALGLTLTGADVDVLAFDIALKRGSANGNGNAAQIADADASWLSRAVALYRGPLLEGCEEPWAQQERAVREEAYLSTLERLARHALQVGEPANAAGYLRRVLARDTTRETALRSLLVALAAAGDRASAVREFRDFRIRLLDAMNSLPSPETRETFERIRAEMAAPTPSPPPSAGAAGLEPAGGAVPLDSALYVERSTDRLFHQAIVRGDSIVLVKGPRQVGKTSLLSRGLHRARAAGCRVVITDLQKLADPERHLASTQTFLLALGRQLADKLELDVSPEESWDPEAGPSENFERFLRRKVLAALGDQPLIWALDEVDQLFRYRWATEVFGLMRSWHNERALDPEGPWSRLTLAMAYATEAHLFITDLNQSPFNVGTRLTLEDFTEAEVAELDRRLGSPLGNPALLSRFTELVGGHPDLVRRGFQQIVSGSKLDQLEAEAARDDGPFGNHLRRLLHALSQDPQLCDAMRELLRTGKKPDVGAFYRLHSAGVLAGDETASARPRCGLYARYLEAHLP